MVVIPSIGGFRAARLHTRHTCGGAAMQAMPGLAKVGTASDSKPLANWQLQHQISNTDKYPDLFGGK